MWEPRDELRFELTLEIGLEARWALVCYLRRSRQWEVRVDGMKLMLSRLQDYVSLSSYSLLCNTAYESRTRTKLFLFDCLIGYIIS